MTPMTSTIQRAHHDRHRHFRPSLHYERHTTVNITTSSPLFHVLPDSLVDYVRGFDDDTVHSPHGDRAIDYVAHCKGRNYAEAQIADVDLVCGAAALRNFEKTFAQHDYRMARWAGYAAQMPAHVLDALERVRSELAQYAAAFKEWRATGIRGTYVDAAPAERHAAHTISHAMCVLDAQIRASVYALAEMIGLYDG